MNDRKNERSDPYSELERLFHEPRRLAILSHLIGVEGGLTFRQIRDLCDLTDGNLNRHLKMLVEARAVRLEKDFVGARPRTTVYLTEEGRKGFVRYLDALEAVLKLASGSARKPEASAGSDSASPTPRVEEAEAPIDPRR